MDNIDKQISDLAVGCLPKWPQMLVSGVQVTLEQAFDIILRTDRFLTDPDGYSNNREFSKWYKAESNLVALLETRKYPEGHEYQTTNWEKYRQLQESIGFVSTEYVSNDWAASCFIGGPHGWCSPAGVISYADNVGKWPNIREVYDDWVKIAEAFPFVDAHVTLMSGESCEDETYPVINFRVKDGAVELDSPDTSVHHNIETRNVDDMINHIKYGCDTGLPSHWYTKAAKIVRSKIESTIKED